MQNLKLIAWQNSVFKLTLDFSGVAAIYDLPNCIIRMQMRQAPFSPVIHEWSTAVDNIIYNVAAKLATFVAPVKDVINFSGDYKADIIIELPNGAPVVEATADITFRKGVTRTTPYSTETDTAGIFKTVEIVSSFNAGDRLLAPPTPTGNAEMIALMSAAWFDFRDVSTLYQTSDTSTPVTTSGQTLGRVSDKTGNGRHALQATAANRPQWKKKSGSRYARSDGVDDFMSINMTGVVSAYVIVQNRHGWMLSGPQYMGGATGWRIPLNEPEQIIVRETAFSDAEIVVLNAYFSVPRQYAIFTSYSTTAFHNIAGPSAPYQITYKGENGLTYQTTANGQSVDVGAQGLTAPITVLYPDVIRTDNSATRIYFYGNGFAGLIPSMQVSSLSEFACGDNQLAGSLPSFPASLTAFSCYNLQLAGSLPILPASLTYYSGANNLLTGYLGTSISIQFGSVYLGFNNLSQAAVDAILVQLAAAGKNSGTRVCDLSGAGNAAPSATGLTAKTTLLGLGWTVTTN